VLTVQSAIKKTREGSTYYYVTDATNPNVNGWVYSKGVTTTKPAGATFNAATDVNVNFVAAGKTVASTTLSGLKADATKVLSTVKGTAVGTDAATQATDAWGKAALTGTGYSYVASDSSNKIALGNAKTGDTISLLVNQNQPTTSKFTFYKTSGNGDLSQAAKGIQAYTTGTTATANTVAFPTVSAGFTGISEATFTASDASTYLTNAGLGTLDTPNYKKSNDTKDYYTEFKLSSTIAGTFGSSTKAFYTASEKTGTSPAKAQTTTGVNDYYTNK